MDRDQVLLAMGRPLRKSRESKDGWIMKTGSTEHPRPRDVRDVLRPKVVKIKETYAGLAAASRKPRSSLKNRVVADSFHVDT